MGQGQPGLESRRSGGLVPKAMSDRRSTQATAGARLSLTCPHFKPTRSRSSWPEPTPSGLGMSDRDHPKARRAARRDPAAPRHPDPAALAVLQASGRCPGPGLLSGSVTSPGAIDFLCRTAAMQQHRVSGGPDQRPQRGHHTEPHPGPPEFQAPPAGPGGADTKVTARRQLRSPHRCSCRQSPH